MSLCERLAREICNLPDDLGLALRQIAGIDSVEVLE
jgi:hypothetical protein